MSVIDDGALTWTHQAYWGSNAGHCPAWLELAQNMNHRCDFLGVARPTLPLIQPDPEVDPVSPLGLCSSAETPKNVRDILSAAQTALNTLETNVSWCDSDGTEYSGYDLTTLSMTRPNLKAICENIRQSLDAHRYKGSGPSGYIEETGSYGTTYTASGSDSGSSPPGEVAFSFEPLGGVPPSFISLEAHSTGWPNSWNWYWSGSYMATFTTQLIPHGIPHWCKVRVTLTSNPVTVIELASSPSTPHVNGSGTCDPHATVTVGGDVYAYGENVVRDLAHDESLTIVQAVAPEPQAVSPGYYTAAPPYGWDQCSIGITFGGWTIAHEILPI